MPSYTFFLISGFECEYGSLTVCQWNKNIIDLLDWAEAQADLSLRSAHTLFCWFSHAAAQRWDQSLLCTLWVAKDAILLHADSEDLIRLGGLDQTESFCWFCRVAAHLRTASLVTCTNLANTATSFDFCHSIRTNYIRNDAFYASSDSLMN